MARGPQQPPKGDPRDDVIEGQVVDSVERVTERALVKASGYADIDTTIVVALAEAQIDKAIEYAHRFRRQKQLAVDNILELTTWDTPTAMACRYALPRGRDEVTGKAQAITGPSVRFFETVAQCWGNCHVDAFPTTVNRKEGYVEAQGLYIDFETNYRHTVTARRRISGKGGKLFSDDMIVVTAQAAVSIAKRNAIKGGIPSPVWSGAYAKVEEVIRGDSRTLGARRVELLSRFKEELGVNHRDLFAALGVKGEADIGLDELVIAAGFFSAIRNREASIEDLMRDAGMVDVGSRTLGNAYAAATTATPDRPPTPTVAPQTAAPAPEAQSPPETADARPGPSDGPGEAVQPDVDAGEDGTGADEWTPTQHEGAAPAGIAYGLAEDGADENELWSVYVDGEETERITGDEWAERELPVYEAHAEKPAPKPPPTRGRTASPRPQEPPPTGYVDRNEERGAPATATTESRSPPSSGASQGVGDAVEQFRSRCAKADSWLQIKPALLSLRNTAAFQALPVELQQAELVFAYQHGAALQAAGKDPVAPSNDPTFYELWLLTAPPPEDVDAAFRLLIRSDGYRHLSPEYRDRLAGLTATAKGEA